LPGERITIRQLARLSGVSIGTVSRALNGYTDVRPETRERIKRLAIEHDYTPAAAARSLVTQRSHVIGVFLETGEGHPDLQHPFFHEVLVGLKHALGDAGYDLLLFASANPGNGYGEHSYLKRCRHHAVEGCVLMGVDTGDEEVRRLVRSGLPSVGVDVLLVGPAATYVASDNAGGAELAVRHLYERGHRRIATIAGAADSRPGADRLRGFRAGLSAHGLPVRADYVAHGDFYVDSGYEAAARLFALDEPPTAIFAASDMMAIGALRAAHERGLQLPADLSVVGFDDIQLAEYLHPALTTIRQDKQGLGAAAGTALLAGIGGAGPTPDAITLPVELVARGSTAPISAA
jgi:LacI family transcriptional regulator